jgi:hypothetical protein
LLAFLPCLAYFLIAPVSVSLALWLAFATAFAVAIRAFVASRMLRIFDAGNLGLFAALTLYDAFVQPGSTPAEINLALEIGLLVTAVWSMSLRLPFTAQYRLVRKSHDPALLVRAHTLLTSLWATAFALMAAAAAATVILHRLSPVWAGGITLILFAAMLTFTWQFGAYIDRHPGNIPFLGKR